MSDGQVDAFIDKFESGVASLATAVRARMQLLIPRGFELVYDNYNALAIGYGPSARASEVVFSFAVYPRWILFFFMRGASLDDPGNILRGKGNQVRHVRIDSLADLDRPEVRRLMEIAIASSMAAYEKAGALQTIVKAISAKQRPRRV